MNTNSEPQTVEAGNICWNPDLMDYEPTTAEEISPLALVAQQVKEIQKELLKVKKDVRGINWIVYSVILGTVFTAVLTLISGIAHADTEISAYVVRGTNTLQPEYGNQLAYSLRYVTPDGNAIGVLRTTETLVPNHGQTMIYTAKVVEWQGIEFAHALGILEDFSELRDENPVALINYRVRLFKNAYLGYLRSRSVDSMDPYRMSYFYAEIAYPIGDW